MPDECYNYLKMFTLCKLDYDEEYKKKNGFSAYMDFMTDPFSRVAGCTTEFNKYNKCYYDFVDRYIDLKNYVAEVEGKPLPFDRKAIDKDHKQNLTTYNYGLNKF